MLVGSGGTGIDAIVPRDLEYSGSLFTNNDSGGVGHV